MNKIIKILIIGIIFFNLFYLVDAQNDLDDIEFIQCSMDRRKSGGNLKYKKTNKEELSQNKIVNYNSNKEQLSLLQKLDEKNFVFESLDKQYKLKKLEINKYPLNIKCQRHFCHDEN